MEKLTVPQLKEELIRMNLSTHGTKAELINRIRTSVRGISVWNSPGLILKHLLLYLIETISRIFTTRVNSLVVLIVALLGGALAVIYRIDSIRKMYISPIESALLWYGWWMGLGVASSIGLGTGLHTFVLFLGPFLARATLTAFTCKNLFFDTRGLDAFVCKSSKVTSISPLIIFEKVFFEVFFWGAGTAIGELPPFFVAKAAALAGKSNPEFSSIESILKKHASKRTFYEKTQAIVHNMVKSLGFWGILILASIPNPLFDLAGVMCGHFGVKFSTFFGATFIGKALFKCNIQALAVIVFFSKDTLAWIQATMIDSSPLLKGLLGGLFENLQEFGDSVPKKNSEGRSSLLGSLWGLFMTGMILYFLISFLESLAIQHWKTKNSPPKKNKIE